MNTIILILLIPVYIILFWLVKFTLGKDNHQALETPFLTIGDTIPSINVSNQDGNTLNINQLNEHILLFVKKTCGSCKQVLSTIDREKSAFLDKKVIIISSEDIERDQVKFQADFITNSHMFNLFNIRVVPTAILVKNGKIEKSIVVKTGDDLINFLPKAQKVSTIKFEEMNQTS